MTTRHPRVKSHFNVKSIDWRSFQNGYLSCCSPLYSTRNPKSRNPPTFYYSHSIHCTYLLSLDDQGIQLMALLCLGFKLLDNRREVWVILHHIVNDPKLVSWLVWSLFLHLLAWCAGPWGGAGGQQSTSKVSAGDIAMDLSSENCGCVWKSYLESSSKTEDTVVCLLRRETLQRLEDKVALFGDQVILPRG